VAVLRAYAFGQTVTPDEVAEAMVNKSLDPEAVLGAYYRNTRLLGGVCKRTGETPGCWLHLMAASPTTFGSRLG